MPELLSAPAPWIPICILNPGCMQPRLHKIHFGETDSNFKSQASARGTSPHPESVPPYPGAVSWRWRFSEVTRTNPQPPLWGSFAGSARTGYPSIVGPDGNDVCRLLVSSRVVLTTLTGILPMAIDRCDKYHERRGAGPVARRAEVPPPRSGPGTLKGFPRSFQDHPDIFRVAGSEGVGGLPTRRYQT